MAASKKRNNKRTSSKKGTAKKTQRITQESFSNAFQTEIILLVVLAAAVILMFSNFGMGGIVGTAISNVSFGTFGLLAYAFPVLLFIGIAFLISNKKNLLAYKKFLAAIVFFMFLCGFVHLLTEGYLKSSTLKDYYALCSDYRTGGGIVGGAICMSTVSAFGISGGYVIIVLVLMVCLILITQRSFFGFIMKIWNGICGLVQGGKDRYAEGQPERDMRRELRIQERQLKKAERLRLLEEEYELGQEILEEEPFMANSLIVPPKDKQASLEKNEETENVIKESNISEKNVPESDSGVGNAYGTKKNVKSGRRSRRKSAEEDLELQLEEALDMDDLQIESSLSSKGQLEFKIHRAEPVYDEDDETSSEQNASFVKPEEAVMPGHAKEAEYGLEEDDDDMPANHTSGDEYDDAYADAEISAAEPAMIRREAAAGNGEKAKGRAKSTAENGRAAKDGSAANAGNTEEIGTRSSKNPKSSPQEIQSGIVNIKHEIDEKEAAAKREYVYPSLNLLKKGSGKQGDSDEYLRKTAKKLQEILHTFGVNVTVTNVSCGPTVTRYELQPEMGVKVSKIVSLADDIKLNLATTDLRIEAPIPGKAAVGIEVPNKENTAVMLRDLLASKEFQSADSKLTFAVGKDIAGETVVADIAKMPHLLIAGSTGSGKSVCINTLIISILYKANPDEVKLIMIDPKVVELSVYNGIPHLLIPVVTDPKKAAGALNWAVSEMSTRYNTFAEYGVRNIGEYNKKVDNMQVPEGEIRPDRMPQIVVIVDELADLMMVAPGEVEDAICRLAQLARAAGIHLIIATQRPSVNVITGLIKANMPSRIAFAVSSGVDSRTILDMVGAEKLLGKGDMLFYPQGYSTPVRLQGSFVSDEEVSKVVEFVSNKNPGATYNTQIEQHVNTAPLMGAASGGESERDTYFEEAGKFIIEKEKASIGMLQRMFKIGFNRAARIMDQLYDAGVVGPEESTKPRKVLMTMEEFQNYLEEYL